MIHKLWRTLISKWWGTPLLVVIVIMVLAAILQPWKPVPKRPCSYYGDWPLKDIPARCIKEYQR